jgi:hypothetical protein
MTMEPETKQRTSYVPESGHAEPIRGRWRDQKTVKMTDQILPQLPYDSYSSICLHAAPI